MELIRKKDLLKVLEEKYEDLTDESGCYVRTSNGNEWLSLSNIVELVHCCETFYEGAEDEEHREELDRAERRTRSLEKELEQTKKAYEKRLELMHTALLKATADNKAVEGVHVTKTDFLAIYQKALNEMFAKEENGTLDPYCNDIYGYDFTIHWHGIYCDCYDGAMPSNHIIPAIEGLNEEDPDEGWGAF